ncbi:MAG: hypothetical protein GC145_16140 [Caulobacter sp.]|nr:hypothetical protein [Caulobacter sp.]
MTIRFKALIAGLTTAAALFIQPAATVAATPAAVAGIPGARTCFWFRPPVGADPYVNVAYPDAAARYWTAVISTPPGATLELNGDFPHARYMSFISYDGAGKPIEALADYRIAPKAGATNPFRTGARRDAASRAYSITIADAQPDPSQIEGKSLAGAGAGQNVLHAPGQGEGRQQVIIMRVYVPDRGQDILGGVPLPEPVLTLADGRRLTGQAACDALNTTQAPALSPAALSIPLAQFETMTHQPDRPAYWPATNPLTWHVQYDRKFLIGIYTGEKPVGARKSEGGFFPNPDNNYIRTIVNRHYGHVLVLRGRMPTVARTLAGDKVMGSGELRYWSICSNQGFANTRATACLFDEEVPLDADGLYTIVVSREADRPRNAIPACGVAWLKLADDGDGAVDENAGVIQIRNMLADPDFAHAIQAVSEIGTEKAVMGPYIPDAAYMMTNSFEGSFACPLP